MEPTSSQPLGGYSGSTHPSSTGSSSSADTNFSTTGSHATGAGHYPTDSGYTTKQSAASGVQGTLNSAVDSSKKWLNDSGLLDQAGQLPQKAKDLSNRALASVNSLSNTQKVVGVSLLAAGLAYLATRSSKRHDEESEYRAKPRRSPFGHKSYGSAESDQSNRPWGASGNRYGNGGSRVSSGSGYSSQQSGYGSRSASDRNSGTGSDRNSGTHSSRDMGYNSTRDTDSGSASYGNSSYGSGGQGSSSYSNGAQGSSRRRDQGPASGSHYDPSTSGHQNPNNLDQLNSAF